MGPEPRSQAELWDVMSLNCSCEGDIKGPEIFPGSATASLAISSVQVRIARFHAEGPDLGEMRPGQSTTGPSEPSSHKAPESKTQLLPRTLEHGQLPRLIPKDKV